MERNKEQEVLKGNPLLDSTSYSIKKKYINFIFKIKLGGMKTQSLKIKL
jgi:hypothetical protein